MTAQAQLERNIGYQLIRLMRAHRQLADTLLSAHGLHVGQEILLVQLWDAEGLTQSQLGERLEIEPSTVSKMISRMEKAGLVTRQPDPDDARISRIYLSEQGRELRGAVLAAWDELEARLVSGLDELERALLRRLIAQMIESLH